jgi:hypothetical protein
MAVTFVDQLYLFGIQLKILVLHLMCALSRSEVFFPFFLLSLGLVSLFFLRSICAPVLKPLSSVAAAMSLSSSPFVWARSYFLSFWLFCFIRFSCIDSADWPWRRL